MSDAPRWPGSDGGPGLDFSPYRTDQPEDGATHVGAADPAIDETKVHTPDWNAEDAAAEAPSRAADAGENLFREDEDSAASAQHGDESAVGDDAKSATPVPPRVAERAARTAQEWAAMPVAPGAGRPSGPGMVAPAAGVAAGAAAVGAGAAGAAAAGAAGAGAAGAGARSGVAPRVAQPAPAPGRAAGAAEQVDPLPLDEVAEARVGAPTSARPVRRPRRTRKARLRLSRIDPWSVMKTTLLFAIAFGIMLVVATFALWSVLAGAGTLDYANTLLNQLFGDQDTEFDVTQILSLNRIMGFAAIVAAINVVIITALATLFSFLYNLAATVMGGLEVTLAED